MNLINTQYDLDKLFESLNNEQIIFMDTEFDRRNTYHAKLCLVQVATKQHQYVIDTLSGVDYSYLKEILNNKKILKVFHSGDQDIKIFHQIFGMVPRNLFDTQAAASAVGFGKSAGYQALCFKLLDINIDKTLQKANWSLRPLKEALVQYALDDVLYLPPLYEKLTIAMREKDAWQKYKNNMQNIYDEQNFIFNPEKILSRLQVPFYTRHQRQNMLEIIRFREQSAEKLNIPRGHFLSDTDIFHLATKLPTSAKALDSIKFESKIFLKSKFVTSLLELCQGIRETSLNNNQL